MDMKNAYGGVLREAILRGLYEYAPHLVRWFIITYGSDTRLFHSLHGFVGWVKTGVKQGDPLSTLFFAVALQAALVEIDRDIATNHPGSMTARAMAFADDGIGVGDGASLLANLPRYECRKYADQPQLCPIHCGDWRLHHRRAHVFLDTLRGSQGSRPAADSRTQGYFSGPSPQDVALRGVMQALVRIQAYILADIVVAIPAR